MALPISLLLFNKAASTSFRTCPFLQNALDQALAGDMVILCPGTHSVCSTGGLEEGGSIIGNENLNVTVNENIIGIVELMQEWPVSNDMCCVLFNQFDHFWIALIQGNSEVAIHCEILMQQ